VTLTIGLLASMYSAIFVTRAIFDCVYSQSNESKLSIGI
jgi:preprotein translocase subunit SecD